MSNRTWVCFRCRRSLRRGASYGESRRDAIEVRCNCCDGPCTYLGYKIRVPSRRDRRGWDALRAQLEFESRHELAVGRQRRTRLKHALEKEIAKLERRPANAGRDQLIRQLRKRLAGI